MTEWYARLGFGQKIQLLINVVSVSVLSVSIVVIGLSFYATFKQNLEHRVLQKSNLLADAAAVGVVFDQPESVNMLLGSLAVDQGVHSAVVFKKYDNGVYRHFAHYDRDISKEHEHEFEPGPVKEWQQSQFILRLPILVDNEEVGLLYFIEDNSYLKDFLLSSLAYLVPVLLFSALAIWLVSRSVQYRLAKPLKELTSAAHDVAYNQDYDKRVAIESDDELGELGKAFNHMLHELAQHESFRLEKEQEIIRLNSELEEKVHERTKELKNSIDNLRVTQQQLVEQEKMASLGELVAGVAHEINTPIGVGITAVSHLDESVLKIQKEFDKGTLTKSRFSSMLVAVTESANIVESNLLRAADLVKAFKSVAVDQASSQPRHFYLLEYVNNILTSLRPKIKRTQHEINVQMDAAIELYCDPGIFSQIITNLVMNSLNHGFTDAKQGTIKIEAEINDQDELDMLYCDDGAGIEPDILKRLFDPFVTTKRGQGGSGLGTHIIYNLITQALRGRIECESELGKGVRFKICIPMDQMREDQDRQASHLA